MTKTCAIALALLLLSAEAASAGDLLDYENRVFRAAEQVERIKTDGEYGQEGVSYIKTLLPRSEQVEMAGSAVNVDNTWLHILMDLYLSERDPQKRLATLNDAQGRLRALDGHLRKEASFDGDSDSAAREKVREILSRSEYMQRGEDRLTAFIKHVRRRVFEFLRDLYLRAFGTLFGAGSEASWFFRGLIIVALACALFIAARLVGRLRPRKKREKKITVLGEEIEATTGSRDLADAALKAAHAGDFRAAVRKLYVSLLFELAERNILDLEANATNHDYLRKVSHLSALAPAMRYLTDRFDYVWYGMFPSSAEEFSLFHARYKEAVSTAQSLARRP